MQPRRTTHFFEELEKIRQSRGLNRREWEDVLDVSSPGFNGWKNGVVPRPESADKVAQRLGLARNLVREWCRHPLVPESSTEHATRNADTLITQKRTDLNSDPGNEDIEMVAARLRSLRDPELRQVALRLALNALDAIIALQSIRPLNAA
jgi:hypothetical protein